MLIFLHNPPLCYTVYGITQPHKIDPVHQRANLALLWFIEPQTGRHDTYVARLCGKKINNDGQRFEIEYDCNVSIIILQLVRPRIPSDA